jgi:hypothetical protein
VPALEIAHEARPLVRYIRFHPRHLLGVNDPVGLVSTINPVYTPRVSDVQERNYSPGAWLWAQLEGRVLSVVLAAVWSAHSG